MLLDNVLSVAINQRCGIYHKCSLIGLYHDYLIRSRTEPIMLLKLPTMFFSNAPKFPLLCFNYAQLCSIRAFNALVNVLLGCFKMW